MLGCELACGGCELVCGAAIIIVPLGGETNFDGEGAGGGAALPPSDILTIFGLAGAAYPDPAYVEVLDDAEPEYWGALAGEVYDGGFEGAEPPPPKVETDI
jgi:hypothetical protein